MAFAARFDATRAGRKLAKSAQHFRSADVTLWAVVALVAWGVAIFAGNVSALIPDSVFAGLHGSRMSGANLNQVRAQVSVLEAETARLKRENTVLVQRFTLAEEARGQVTRRVGNIEISLPKLLEALPPGAEIDRTVTASTNNGGTTTYAVDGGTVSVTQRPLNGGTVPTAPQPMPPLLDLAQPDSSAFGVALGAPVDADEVEIAWRTLGERAGTLLVGLGPLVANMEGTSGKRLVAGPFSTSAGAMQFCGRMAKAGIACQAVPFIGEPLPLLN